MGIYFYEAQELFRQNAGLYPSHFSFNNWGQHYITEGRKNESGKVYCAKQTGIHYLKKAASMKETSLNLTNLGMEMYGKEAFQEAYQYFDRANELNADIRRQYNMAVCLFQDKKYGAEKESYSVIKEMKGFMG